MSWIMAEDVPKHLEGKRAWIYDQWSDSVEMGWVPRDYSRAAHHCRGIYVWPVDTPRKPDLPKEAAE